MRFPFKVHSDRKFDVVGFGTNAVDFLIQVPHYPAFNSKVELTEYTQAAGGEVATTMAGLQRLGLKTCYIGRFGTDAAGDFGTKTLSDEGVDLTYAQQIEGAKTQIAFIVIDERNGERTVIWQRDKRLSFTETEAPLEAVSQAKVFHFTPHDVQACIAMAKQARAGGVVVSSDIDNVFDGIEMLLPLADMLIMSSEFPVKLLGIVDKRMALAELRSRYGCEIVGVTLGKSGSLLLCGDTFIETPGFAVPGGCKDTTGAGDAFRVGLIYGLLKGESVENAARTANEVAALKCRAVGARTSLPDVKDLSNLLI